MDLLSALLALKLQARPSVDHVLRSPFFKAADGGRNDGGDDDAIVQTIDEQKRRALHTFQQQPNSSYTTTIKSVTRFQLAADFMAIDMTFRQTAAAIGKGTDSYHERQAPSINLWLTGCVIFCRSPCAFTEPLL
ncbi:hypothetical protein BASA50_002215 [Batrachochytrium salamandrivorans]|uniref:Uncharacterized protein n=1 Tax=Batrachochytrium salamandrivorans TaxID=1357716 RepID=A0ABQ8FM69_9FUNG|nr:hypothetical protein BASA50_002215 [Batrachochytrium salamandrivorans]